MYKERSYVTFKLIFWTVLFLPAFFTAVFGKLIADSNRLKAEGKRVEAKVLSVRDSINRHEDGDTYYYVPTVEYIIQGKPYVVTLDASLFKYSIGEKIELLYMQGSETKPLHNSYYTLYAKSVGRLIVTLALTAFLGGLIYLFLRKAALT